MLSNAMDGNEWVFLLLVTKHHSLWHFPVDDGKNEWLLDGLTKVSLTATFILKLHPTSPTLHMSSRVFLLLVTKHHSLWHFPVDDGKNEWLLDGLYIYIYIYRDIDVKQFESFHCE